MQTSLQYYRLRAARFLHFFSRPDGRRLHYFLAGLLLLVSLQTQGQSQTFTCTGAPQSYTVPDGITSLSIEVKGAQGGTNFTQGGGGAIVKSVLTVTPGAVLNLYVGCQASGLTGGFNGGGTVTATSNSAGGGGASDIRMGGIALSNRIIVAAGGGGGGGGAGGVGGGHTGSGGNGAGFSSFPGGGSGGTQSAGGAGGTFSVSGYTPQSGGNGSLGQGGTSSAVAVGAGVGGGGGGYYGGGGGGSGTGSGGQHGGGGGGGSSFVSSSSAITNVTSTPGGNLLNGSIVITLISPVPACNTFVPLIDGSSFANYGYVNDVFVAGSTVYAATKRGFSTSTDGRKTFVAQSVVRGEVRKIFVQGNTIYASGPQGLSLINGQTVTTVLSGSLLAPTNVFAVGNTIYVTRVGTATAFGISTNNGGSFTFYPIGFPVDNLSGRCVYATGSRIYVGSSHSARLASGLYVSTNNGVSFSRISTTSGEGRAIHAFGNTVYFASSAGLFISTDAGVTFTKRTTTDGLGSNSVNDVFAVGTTVYAATDNGLSISTNGGVNFRNYTPLDGLGEIDELAIQGTTQRIIVNAVYAAGTTVYAATENTGNVFPGNRDLYASGLAIQTSQVLDARPGDPDEVVLDARRTYSYGATVTTSLASVPPHRFTFLANDINTSNTWSPGNIITKDLSVTVSAAAGGRSVYSVTATGGSCPGSASVVVNVVGALLVRASSDLMGNPSTVRVPIGTGRKSGSARLATPEGLKAATTTTIAPIVSARGPSGYYFTGRARRDLTANTGSPQNDDNFIATLPNVTQPGIYTINVFDALTKELLSVFTFTR